MRKKLLGIGILISIGVGILAGCGEKKVDYSMDGMEETAGREESRKRGVAQFAGISKWNDTWKVDTAEEGTKEVKVQADILLPDAKQMSVAEVKVPEMNAEYKEQIAKRIFGNEQVYYHDFDHLLKRELKERYDIFKEAYDENPRVHAGLKEEMELLESAMEMAKDNYTPADKYEVDEYIGKYDGKEYELNFSGELDGGDHYGQYIDFRVKDASAVCPKEYKGCTVYMDLPYGNVVENECRLSEEEAERLAVRFIEKLGLEFPILSYTNPLLWGEDIEDSSGYRDWPANGYAFHFEYGLDGVSFSGYGGDREYFNMTGFPKGDVKPYTTSTKLTICVTEQGIIAMHVENPVVTTEVTESVELLPLDTIMKIMKEQITERYEEFHFYTETDNPLQFTYLELIYFRVSDASDQKRYSYVPAWRLCEEKGILLAYERSILNPVIINAIDGSLIELGSRSDR